MTTNQKIQKVLQNLENIKIRQKVSKNMERKKRNYQNKKNMLAENWLKRLVFLTNKLKKYKRKRKFKNDIEIKYIKRVLINNNPKKQFG